MTSTNGVKNLAFKLREKRTEKRRLASGKKAIEVIDLETVPSPTAKEAVKWASDLTIEDEKILLNDGEWLTDRLINVSQRLIKWSLTPLNKVNGQEHCLATIISGGGE